MIIYKPYLIYSILFFWCSSLIVFPISDFIFIGRFFQISSFLIFGLTIITILTNNKIYSNTIVRFMFIWGIYAFFVNIINIKNTQLSPIDTFIEVNWWICIFILFYGIYINDIQQNYTNFLISKYPYFYFFIFLLITYRMIFSIETVNFSSIKADDINSIYWVLVLVPFAFFLENNFLKYLIVSSAFVLILVSSKRVATIAISLITLFFVIQITFKSKNFFKRFLASALLIFSFMLLIQTTIDRLEINVFDRFEEAENESRLTLYTETWERFKSKDLIFKIIGSGHRSTANEKGSELLSKTSHNDFLEVLYDYGILGLIFYLWFIFQILTRLKWLHREKNKYFFAYFSAFIVFFSMSMASHLIIYPSYFSFIVILWALIEARYTLQRKHRHRHKF